MMKELPPEVLAQMRTSRKYKTDMVLDILKEDPRGYTTLDDLVREMYLATGQVVKRHSLVQMLYELRQNGRVTQDEPGIYFLVKQGKK